MANLMAIKDLVVKDWDRRAEERRQQLIDEILAAGRERMESIHAELASVDQNPRNPLCGGEILGVATGWLLREEEGENHGEYAH